MTQNRITPVIKSSAEYSVPNGTRSGKVFPWNLKENLRRSDPATIIITVMALALDLNDNYNYTVEIDYSYNGLLTLAIYRDFKPITKCEPMVRHGYIIDRKGIWDCNCKTFVTLVDIKKMFETYRQNSKGKKYISPI